MPTEKPMGNDGISKFPRRIFPSESAGILVGIFERAIQKIFETLRVLEGFRIYLHREEREREWARKRARGSKEEREGGGVCGFQWPVIGKIWYCRL